MAGLQPIQRIKPFVITVPAGTAITAPQSTDLTFTPATVVGLELVIPPGHNGMTGIQIAQAGTAVLPDETGDWLIGSGEKIEWPLLGFLNTGDWQAFTYNTASIPHSFYIRFLLEVLDFGQGSFQSAGPLALT